MQLYSIWAKTAFPKAALATDWERKLDAFNTGAFSIATAKVVSGITKLQYGHGAVLGPTNPKLPTVTMSSNLRLSVLPEIR